MTALRRSAGLVVALGIGLLAPLVGAGPVFATDPTFEPDPSSVGSLTFYDATGNVITGGTLPSDTTTTQPLAAYVVGSTNVHGTDTKATVYYATPDPGNTQAWSTIAVGGVTTFPVSGAPSPISGLAADVPVWKGSASDLTLTQWSDPTDGVPNTETGTNANVYQIRMYTNNPSPAGSSYDSADVLVDNAAHTWAVVYNGTPTTTSLQVSPTSPAAAGTQETLTATVSAGVAGQVQFFDGATSLGAAVTVASDHASMMTTLASGAHSLTATFTPTSTSNRPSTSDPVSYTVSAQSTTTTLQVTPASSAAAGSSVSLTATVTPATAAGSVQFFDGANNIGSHVVSGGSSTFSTSTLALGSHSLTAHFVPTSSAAFIASQSAAQTYTITAGSTSGGAPTNSVPPMLTGTAKAGTNESCTNGTWSNAATYTYAFSVGGVIVQADSANAILALTGAMVGKAVTCTVTAHGTGGSATATTAPVTVLVGAAPHPKKAVKLIGAAKVGKTLKVGAIAWPVKPSKVTYQWKLNGKAIKKASKAAFKVVKADKGKKLSCTITATFTGFAKAVVNTNALKVS